jgi:hypothetical protein
MIQKRKSGEAGIGAPQLGRYLRVAHRHAADVGLIYDGFCPRSPRWAIVSPIKACVDYHRTGDIRRIVSKVGLVLGMEAVGRQRRVGRELTDHLAGVGIEQQLGRIGEDSC